MTCQIYSLPNFNVVLVVFVCECVRTSTLILGDGGKGDIMSEGRRIFRMVVTLSGCLNFCHNICLSL